MIEVTLPRIGNVKLSWGDFAYLMMGVGLALWGVWTIVTVPMSITWGIGFAQILIGFIICWLTIGMGRKRVKWEMYPNPVKLREAIWNHALAEGMD